LPVLFILSYFPAVAWLLKKTLCEYLNEKQIALASGVLGAIYSFLYFLFALVWIILSLAGFQA